MALARIITRSQACSRELALDLLARGYIVEIVSPDAIPDNIADLELRVDAGPGDQLIASVDSHDGERSASLEFVHHLKAPMVDFMRRPPELGEAVRFPNEPVIFDTEPSPEDVELPAEVPQLAHKAEPDAFDALRDPEPKYEESVHLIAPLQQLPSFPAESPAYSAADETSIVVPMLTESAVAKATTLGAATADTMTAESTFPLLAEPIRRWRSAGWLFRAAITFASVVSLALGFGFGFRQTGDASAQSPGPVPAPTDVALMSAPNPERSEGKEAAKDPEPTVALAASTPATKSEGKYAEVPTPDRRSQSSRRHGDDLIARDTVTYLDKRYEQNAANKPAAKAAPAKGLPSRHRGPRQPRGGVIAANKVTYFDNSPAPKTSK